jgi:hypothetical protein
MTGVLEPCRRPKTQTRDRVLPKKEQNKLKIIYSYTKSRPDTDESLQFDPSCNRRAVSDLALGPEKPT